MAAPRPSEKGMSETTRPCEICGQPIKPGRLKAVPETRLCITHAEMADELGGEFRLVTVQASLGKSGSLKKNYGDVGGRLARNEEVIRKLRKRLGQG
jgi:hypothetical protein